MNKIRYKKEVVAPSMWQVWWACIKYDGAEGYKKRPVLVMGTKGDECTIAEMSSRPPSYDSDVPIVDLVHAGLTKESVVKTWTLRAVSKSSLKSRMGNLSYVDRDRVKNAIEARVC